ncbi:dual specificity protein phosphatase 12 isoform X2 [Hyla sarda]|uniref:dual specificity protein phosphatase 12 isoform X2 n=1 Tax=Hyla sarda TaxID=327740 RepID=UPI0024C320A7|nr:dual specificity protein phosphatase 12 isoform X2 [Hyla sarda]XP_056379534.1 dual specificity protein phosphatase 12 isoform X2 [Hyla sarda]XP_056379535.1 dual specificity protein phosphatase 12 isoform X2 [Hyla sarda]
MHKLKDSLSPLNVSKMICVLPGLYIGGVPDVTDVQSLQASGITHILTVDSAEPKDLPPSLQKMFIRLLDDSSADLLSYLPECLTFLTSALETPGSCVLVHCHAGMSRSAAVIVAYMMNTARCPYEEAYRRLQNKKSDVKIHEEFENQLALFEEMGCDVDTSSASYKQYRLQKVTQKFPELQKVPQEVFASDPASMGQSTDILFRCRKCRRSLFRAGSILNHTLGDGPAAFAHKRLASLQASQDPTKCTSFFVEPVRWMEDALLGVLDGQLLCPKCNAKLGSFNWYGDRCSCGRWVTPAFQVHKNRVDEVKPLPIHGR